MPGKHSINTVPENGIPCELLRTFGFESRGSIQLLYHIWILQEPSKAVSFFLEVQRQRLEKDEELKSLQSVRLKKFVLTFLSVALSLSSPLQQARRS